MKKFFYPILLALSLNSLAETPPTTSEQAKSDRPIIEEKEGAFQRAGKWLKAKWSGLTHAEKEEVNVESTQTDENANRESQETDTTPTEASNNTATVEKEKDSPDLDKITPIVVKKKEKINL